MKRLGLVAGVALTCLLGGPPSGTAGTLSEDGRAGTVTAVEGLALARPAGRGRWTPLDPRSLVFPGDVVRTEARGAHALELRLVGGGRLVLGPGTTIELERDGGTRLLRGEAEVRGPDASPLRVTGPGDWRRDVVGTVRLSAREGETKELAAEPAWLKGYRASTTDEWMGSLLAKVDGRDVPLSVGWHKVTVEIRDQIARTTVEESFVNATDGTLEGVFSFPLPADASISGFGMWIGDELVEADLVERERARAIYEDVLRRKKDPGLLEWEGGNLFKARVYPIPPRAEKRVRIRYTEVLPLEGSAYRYRYALRSELLRAHPLRDLSIAVNVVSAAPIASVTSPTHEVVTRTTEHEASVTFAAQEYVPERDFEVAVEVGRGEGLSAVSHRRGEDGWFLLFVAPPDPAAAGWRRDLVPEGRPLDLVVVADTSGSMDPRARASQSAFVAALLGQLSPEDRFRLLAVDVTTHALAPQALPATEENVGRALDGLERRASLGWTDLDGLLAAVLPETGPGTQVVYVGDGIHTAGDPEPSAVAARLKAAARASRATFHAVSTSSSYEKAVLEALASIGGGTVRRADEGPTAAAKALLGEIARPGLRDARIRIEGVPTARVYPEVLPPVPVGEQRAVLGRFLPGSRPATAQVVLTGTLDGAPVRWSSAFSVPAADEGNSFLPRLWARRHLDALLARPQDPATKAEVVAFSREQQIMTPYTSFLVLESDEERERYGVERTVKTRDAERFFAEAADRVALEVARQSAQDARRWRADLRRRMLREIEGLGRDLPVPVAYGFLGVRSAYDVEIAQAVHLATYGGEADYARGDTGVDLRGIGFDGEAAVEEVEELHDVTNGEGDTELEPSNFTPPSEPTAQPCAAPCAPAPTTPPPPRVFEFDGDVPVVGDPQPEPDYATWWSATDRFGVLHALGDAEDGKAGYDRPGLPALSGLSPSGGAWFTDGLDGDFRGRMENAWGSLGTGGDGSEPGRAGLDRPLRTIEGALGVADASAVDSSPRRLGFPDLPDPAPDPRPTAAPAWDPAILEAIRALDRRPALASFRGGLRVRSTWERLHPVSGRVTGRGRAVLLLAAGRWDLTSDGAVDASRSQWLTATERGATDLALRLGRRRPATDAERAAPPPFVLRDGSTGDLLAALARTFHRTPRAAREGDVLTITLPADADPALETVLVVDLARKALLERRVVLDGRTRGALRFGDFVAAAGTPWARRVEVLDADGRVAARQTLDVAEDDAVAAALDAARAAEGDVVFLDGRDPEAGTAEAAIRGGKAGLGHHLVRVVHLLGLGRWEEARRAWEPVEPLVAGRPGADWMRLALLAEGRRGEELLGAATRLAGAVAKDASPWAPRRADVLDARTSGLGARERLGLVEALAPAWARAGPDADLRGPWSLRRRAAALDAAGAGRAAREARAALARERPFDAHDVRAHAEDLRRDDDGPAAARYLEERATKGEEWTRGERDALFRGWLAVRVAQRDAPAIALAADAWLAARPGTSEPHVARLTTRYLIGEEAAADRAVLDALSAPAADLEDPAKRAGVLGAVRVALGTAPGLSWTNVPAPWRAALADLALRCARTGARHAEPTDLVLGDWRFGRTEERRALVDALRADLLAEGAMATWPVPRLRRHLAWTVNGAEPSFRDAAAKGLLARWRATSDPVDADLLAREVDGVLPTDGRAEERIAFLRERLARAEGTRAAAVASLLLDAILAAPHEGSREAEAFDLLPRAIRREAPEQVSRLQAADRVRRLAAWVHEARREAALGTPEERAKRTRAEARRAARDAATAAAAASAARFTQVADPVLQPWIEAERLAFAAEARTDLARTEGEARELLDWIRLTEHADRLLGERAAAVLAYAATRRGAPEGLADRVLALFRTRVASEGTLLDDRYHVFRLLVALDRPVDLEKDLVAWAGLERDSIAWPLALAYSYAETDRPREATAALERAAARADLPRSAWEAAARWYLVLREDARREAALETRASMSPEWDLRSEVSQAASRFQAGGADVPSAVAPETLIALRHLLAKASWGRADAVTSLYRPTKDVRVLEALADGVAGGSPEAAYALLAESTAILQEVHEEATLDALAGRLRTRAAAATRESDRRALRLLLVATENRATGVPRPDPRHAARARDALAQAASGSLAPGENVWLAKHLGTLDGAPALGGDVPRLLEGLLAGTDGRPLDRLAVGRVLAEVLWRRGARDAATARLEAILGAMREGAGGTLPGPAMEAYGTLIGWWVEAGRWREAERRLREDVAREPRPDRREVLRVRLLALHADALERGGATSLGAGAALFRDAVAATEAWLASAPPPWVQEGLAVHARLHAAAAKSRAVPDAGARYDAFVRERLDAFAARDPLASSEHHLAAWRTLAAVAAPRAALAAALARMEREPAWTHRVGADAWARSASDLPHWRRGAGPLGDLEPRLLAAVLAHFAEDLVSGSESASGFVHRGSTFWAERADDFARVAQRLAEERAGEPAVALRAANYLRSHLGRHPEAVAALTTAVAHGADTAGVRAQLAGWLVEDRRFEEAWPLVERLAKEAPDEVPHRLLGAAVLHGLRRDADALAWLDDAARRWKERKSWTAETSAAFGAAALDVGDGARAVAWTEEALRMREEAAGKATPDGTRAAWYGTLAKARSLLGDTDAAVKAAAAAVVAWGGAQRAREGALETLRDVLAKARDLDAWVGRYETEVAASGMDAPVIRKALGRVHLERHRADAAVLHLRAARDLDPLDGETHGLLVQALDAGGDAPGARLALLASVRMAPKNLAAYPDLARRFVAAGEPAEAERARTSAVEAMPSEPDGWRVLAKIREEAGLWARAARGWGHVIRLRPKEPDGWLALATAQARAGDAAAARATIASILATAWEEGPEDVRAKAEALRKEIR